MRGGRGRSGRRKAALGFGKKRAASDLRCSFKRRQLEFCIAQSATCDCANAIPSASIQMRAAKSVAQVATVRRLAAGRPPIAAAGQFRSGDGRSNGMIIDCARARRALRRTHFVFIFAATTVAAAATGRPAAPNSATSGCGCTTQSSWPSCRLATRTNVCADSWAHIANLHSEFKCASASRAAAASRPAHSCRRRKRLTQLALLRPPGVKVVRALFARHRRRHAQYECEINSNLCAGSACRGKRRPSAERLRNSARQKRVGGQLTRERE